MMNNTTAVSVCKLIFLQQTGEAGVRILDVAIVIPNILFLIFLVYKFPRIRTKLTNTKSPVFFTFFLMVYISTIISVIRAVTAMFASGFNIDGKILVKGLWLLWRFFLVSLELMVLLFGLFFGHLDSRTSIKRALIATGLVSGLFSTSQAGLEFDSSSDHGPFLSDSSRVVIFSHGGVIFLLVSSSVFALLYLSVCLAPLTCLQRILLAPSNLYTVANATNAFENDIHILERKKFYVYCAILCSLYSLHMVGSALVLCDVQSGLCILALPVYLYYVFYLPTMYYSFFRGYGAIANEELFFSYSHQKDMFANLADVDSTRATFENLHSPRVDITAEGFSVHSARLKYSNDNNHEKV
ncbi:Transmembrane protein adipocyte-associated 1 [Trichinella pseudospiralis]|uniref:Transmembrane protein adipocyte-associated 1 n=1 Tax=Trichinella pseudospiralis TaxID=6337 RepID=A0A0V1J6X2_TRIPS|nr:Transmembrane protein adipocyte-associated 1 [Trichinella pseudospiralis]